MGAYPDGDNFGVVGLDGDEIVGDDGEHVAVDTEFLDSLGAAVDQTQTVGLASLEVELGEGSALDAGIGLVRGRAAGEIHLAVDQVVVGVGSEVRWLVRRQCVYSLGNRERGRLTIVRSMEVPMTLFLRTSK